VRRRGAALAAGGLALLCGGCGRADERAAIEARLRSRAAADVVREAAAARYEPPADGRLTEAQVRMFLEVRERECRIREAAALAAQRRREAPPAEAAEKGQATAERQDAGGGRAARDARDGAARGPRRVVAPAAEDEADLSAAADLRAAQELHVNPKEYRWVRDRVQEAQAEAIAQALYQKMIAGREQLLAHKRKELESMTDAGERATARRDIEDWQRGLQGGDAAVAPAMRANMALLARFREPLAHLQALEERALAASAGLDVVAATGTGR
jgi:hypothetical protein